MNPYLSKDEKEILVRIMSLKSMLERAIDLYAGLKRTDKKFLTELRHARTRLQNAADIRMSFLDEAAVIDFLKSLTKLHLMFVPTDKAKQEHQEMLQLTSVVPFEMTDFEDWYEFVIEYTCKVCNRTDFKKCPARRILMKYGVFPYNPEARDLCQYSYLTQDGIGVVGGALLQAMSGGGKR